MCILRSLPEKTKLDFDQDLKTCLIFCFEKMAIELNTWDENMHQEKKMYYGNFFYFRAQKCIQNQIPEDQNRAIKGF